MVGIVPRAINDLLACADELNGQQLKVCVSGRYAFLKPNQASISQNVPFSSIQSIELFTNKVIAWMSDDQVAQSKTILIQFKIEKIVTPDQTDVNFLSVYRFPSLETYKRIIKRAKQEAERTLHLKLVNSSFKPNQLQLLGVLSHLQQIGVTKDLARADSIATLNDDLRSTSNSSMLKQRFIQASQKRKNKDRKSKPLLSCNSCLVLTVQDK